MGLLTTDYEITLKLLSVKEAGAETTATIQKTVRLCDGPCYIDDPSIEIITLRINEKVLI